MMMDHTVGRENLPESMLLKALPKAEDQVTKDRSEGPSRRI
jgi:hypothetical protein